MTATAATPTAKWPEMKVDIKKAWGKLTETELENTHGDMKKIGSLLVSRYGSNEKFGDKLSEIFKKFETRPEASASAAASAQPAVAEAKPAATEALKAAPAAVKN